MAQRPVREIVERPLAGPWLVDRVQDPRRLAGIGARQRHRDEERVVARLEDPPDDLDLAVAQHLQRGWRDRAPDRPAQLT